MMEQMGMLPAAAASPRIDGGVLKWYAGDTFQLQVHMELTDQNGSPVNVQRGQQVTFVFQDHRGREVYRVTFENVEDNCVTLVFDGETSGLFPAGDYTYDVIYSGSVRKTLVHRGPVWVE